MKESKLKGKFIRNYRNEKGTIVFVYEVSGSKEALDRYEQIRRNDLSGDQYRVDEATGKPLFFSINYTQDNVDIIITPKDRVIIDNSELQKAASLVSQFGGNLGQALAMEKAKELMAGSRNSSTGSGTPVTPTADPAKVGDL